MLRGPPIRQKISVVGRKIRVLERGLAKKDLQEFAYQDITNWHLR